MNYNLIFDDETTYGFIAEIVKMFRNDIANLPDDDILKEGLEEALKIMEDDDGRTIWKCYYNPMGAFVFTKMVEAE